MRRLSTPVFLFSAILIASGALYLHQQAVLRQQRMNALYQHIEDLTISYQHRIDDLTRLYDDTARELSESTERNEELSRELQDILAEIEAIEARNRQLEQILFNQRETYRNAIALNGSTMKVLSTSNFTAVQYERAWTRLGAHGLKGTGAALVRAEEVYGVNSLVLASIAYHESAGGMSRIARDKNNLFGLGAYDHDPYRYAYTFNTKDECIYYAANILSSSYLSRWGRNYRGDNLRAIGIRYATDPYWAEKVSRNMSRVARAAIPEGR
ncbi:MAG TPA: hypothetical protein GX706_04530 [Candidatus Moranbacteria bacterium]|jgi:beta-N-acetylglucosaminidase|nr:hypothetical protein [Candidatus Moranbacteria bacterium]